MPEKVIIRSATIDKHGDLTTVDMLQDYAEDGKAIGTKTAFKLIISNFIVADSLENPGLQRNKRFHINKIKTFFMYNCIIITDKNITGDYD